MPTKTKTVTVGQALKNWRGVKVAYDRGNFGQEVAAFIIGAPLATYRDWENERRQPRGLSLRVILDTIRRQPSKRALVAAAAAVKVMARK